VQQADQILVIDHGRLCERGTHATLLAASGTYARLHDLQSNQGISAPSFQPSG
jgi:ABC-type multidrug transport system fused ATPase/permease subunit